jgi:hypothetical protein
MGSFKRAVTQLKRHAVFASIFVGVIALGLRLLLVTVIPPPRPAIADEFSYLLAADTFSHGRLTNPTHPMWIHFETFHELSRPTYASKYPPGMGLMLAVGQVVFHAPWVAVWISMAVLCGLITWTLWAWLPPTWAIAGGLLTALQLTGSYWDSYWGGTLAAIGGALLVGAMARLMRRPARASAIIFGLGLAILANTRPYEGFVLGGLCTLFLLARLISLVRRGREDASHLVRVIGVPLLSVLLPTILWMGYYNYRITGNPLLMPYMAYDKQYSIASMFLWSTKIQPKGQYNHEPVSKFVDWYLQQEDFDRNHVALVHARAFVMLYFFCLSIPLVLCLVYSSWRLLRSRRFRIPLMLLFLFYLGVAVEVASLPHYFAPGIVLLFLMITAAVRDVSLLFSKGRVRNLATSALLCWIVLAGISRIAYHLEPAGSREYIAKRDLVIARLNKEPGKVLVFVRYGPKHNIHFEWVFNDANIDESRIVWAHSLPNGKDDELLHYYPTREAWILEDDGETTLWPIQAGPAGAVRKILIEPHDKYEHRSDDAHDSLSS